ncbi:MAG: beta-ketoacyl-ACP synthase 3, partial [Bdellovibrionales bacterium]|nr:beta-ketoacyl-ACP synthase 3 [Bdellovibrionales bacterium]
MEVNVDKISGSFLKSVTKPKLFTVKNIYKIVGVGSFLPSHIVTNHDLSKRLGVTPEWICLKTGILERRYSTDAEDICFMAVQAGNIAILNSNIKPSQIGLLLVATSSPDKLTPSVSTSIQEELGLTNAWAFDLSAGCSGFLFALKTAASILYSSAADYALVIGADRLSSFLDWSDKKSSILFGDGAGAFVIKKNGEIKNTYKDTFVLHSTSDIHKNLSIQPQQSHLQNSNSHFLLKMNGREVFKSAVSSIAKSTSQLLDNHGISTKKVNYFICHQANERIIKNVGSQLKFIDSQVPINI